MQQTIINWATSPEFALLGFVVALVSFAASIYFYLRSIRERRPSFLTRTLVLVEGSPHHPTGLEFTYKGVPQSRIGVTKVLFWNAGQEAIRKTDLSDSDPLTLIVLKTNVLNASIIDSKPRLGSTLVATEELNEFRLNFEYLDHGDYILIQIVHNGALDVEIGIIGKIIGAKRIYKDYYPDDDAALAELARKLASANYYKNWNMAYAFALIATAGFQLFRGHYAWYVWLALAFGVFLLFAVFVVYRSPAPISLRGAA